MDHHHHNTRRAGLAAPERARVVPADLAPLGAPGAAAAGLSAPHKDEAHRLAGDQPGATDYKRFATLRARLALANWGLIRTDPSDGAPIYFATRWNMPFELADLAAVEAFANRVGATR